MNLTQKAAAYVANLSLGSVPANVQDKARQALRDHLGCALAGSLTDLGTIVRQTLTLGPEGPALLLGTTRGAEPGLAAFCNAVAANALDFDDTSGAGHPGASIIPAALAAASLVNCSGSQFLTAIIAGYEVGLRVAAAIRPSWERYRQVHGIGTAQVFGAAAAASRILGLDAEAITRAFGIAGSLAPVPHAGKFGWDERPLTWMKDNTAWPAEAGLRSALLARSGWQASRSILDGPTGFWIMASSDRFEPGRLESYDSFLLLDLSFKPYPCCRWLHTALDALGYLQVAHGLSPDSVERVEVETISPVSEQFMDRSPRTMVDAQFSLPYAMAMKLMNVEVGAWWSAVSRTLPKAHILMQRVEARHNPLLTERYLAMGQHNGCIPASVSVWLTDGTRWEAYEEVALGEPRKPLSEDQLRHKFEVLTKHLLDEKSSQSLLEQLANVQDLETLEPLFTLLRRSTTKV
ncbi:MAG: MmgE/PrpD family protein [Anaerolineae bacterium]